MRLLGEAAGLKAVRLGNVVLVTTKAHATELRNEPDLAPRRRAPGLDGSAVPAPGVAVPGGPAVVPLAPPTPPAAGPKPRLTSRPTRRRVPKAAVSEPRRARGSRAHRNGHASRVPYGLASASTPPTANRTPSVPRSSSQVTVAVPTLPTTTLAAMLASRIASSSGARRRQAHRQRPGHRVAGSGHVEDRDAPPPERAAAPAPAGTATCRRTPRVSNNALPANCSMSRLAASRSVDSSAASTLAERSASCKFGLTTAAPRYLS